MGNVFAATAALALATTCLSFGDDQKEVKAMEGTWLPSTAELGGKPFPEETRKIMKLIMENGKYTVMVGTSPDKGTVEYDSSKKPKEMTIKGTEGPNKGKTILAIYEISNDTLRVCYDLSGKARPTEFKTSENPLHFLVTYKREKP